MAIDPNIALNVKPIQLPNPLEQYMQVQQIQGAQNQNRLADLMYADKQRQVDATLALNQQYKSSLNPDGTIDRAKLFSGVADSGYGSQLPAIQKSFLDMDKTQADLVKAKADAAKQQIDAAGKRLELFGQAMNYVRANPTLDNAFAALDHLGSNGVLTPEQVAQHKAEVQADPTKIQSMADEAFRSALSAKDQLAKFDTRNIGATTDTLAIDPVTGQTKVVSSVKNTVSPDAALSAATSRANTNANIAKDFAINGMKPDGTPNLGNQASMVDMLGKYQLNPTVALQRLPAGARASLIAQVQAKYPGWDETQYDAKKGAAAKFTYGDQGNQMRSFATAGEHLDQLGDLVDQLDNTGSPAYNLVKNKMSAWLGGTAPTNLDAAKGIVSKEVTKAIVANGGGEGERQELANQLSNARTPAQLKGVIQQYRGLMSAQYDNLLEQRRAAGLPDSTLPKYHSSAPAASVPMTNSKGWTLHVDANGNKAYVSPDGKSFEEVK